MTSVHPLTALITGASSGIGLELAKLCAADGYDLILVARNKAALETIATELHIQHGIAVIVLALDLSNHSSVEQLISKIKQKELSIDILINNAGVGVFGYFAETELSQELAMVQLNIVALTALTKACVQQMVAKKSGKILNVASLAAFKPGPLMAVYYATKAYVLSFSEALAEELQGTGITVTVLCPGATNTGFSTASAMEKSKLFMHENLPRASVVARAGYKGMLENKTIVLPGFKNKLFVQLLRLTPRILVRKIVRKIQEVKK